MRVTGNRKPRFGCSGAGLPVFNGGRYFSFASFACALAATGLVG
jgi:hypothetical protein